MSAKDTLLRSKTGKIGYLVQLKQDAGDDTKIRTSQLQVRATLHCCSCLSDSDACVLQGLTREQILKFIDDHPGSAKFFHESLFSRELSKAMEKIRQVKDPLPIAGTSSSSSSLLKDFETYVLQIVRVAPDLNSFPHQGRAVGCRNPSRAPSPKDVGRFVN